MGPEQSQGSENYKKREGVGPCISGSANGQEVRLLLSHRNQEKGPCPEVWTGRSSQFFRRPGVFAGRHLKDN